MTTETEVTTQVTTQDILNELSEVYSVKIVGNEVVVFDEGFLIASVREIVLLGMALIADQKNTVTGFQVVVNDDDLGIYETAHDAVVALVTALE